MSEQEKPGPIRGTIEFIGAHPFATGLLAILGVVGFVISVAGFRIDHEESAETTQQIATAQTTVDTVASDVSEVREVVTANCSGPPCWTLREFAQWSTIGRPKDLIDRKLPAPERVTNSSYSYNLDGCWVSVEYTNDAVSYFSADLSKYVEETGPDGTPNGNHAQLPCDVDVEGLISARSSMPAPDQLAISDVIAALEAQNPDAAFPLDLQIASACLDCGNYAEPYLELMRFGPHAADFVNLHVTTDFRPVSTASGIGTYDLHRAFREAMRDRIGPDAQYGVETPPLCGQNLTGDVATLLGQARVSAIGLGKGARSWSNVLYCEWWK